MFSFECYRLMSDYNVSLVNDSLQEFIVTFKGPIESASLTIFFEPPFIFTSPSTIRWRRLDNPCGAPRSVSVQVSQYRVYEQDIPSKYR